MKIKNKESLYKVLIKNFFKTTLIPLIVIEITLLVLYFGISSFMIDEGKNSLEKEIQTNLNTILSKEVQNIDFQLKEISSLASILQNDQEKKFKEKENILKIYNSEKFAFANNGVYYKTNNDGGSSLFYGTLYPIKKEQKQKAAFTKSFDELLKYSVNNNDLIVASYFNSYDHMNRLYPFIPNVYNQYSPKIKMEDYNFYYDANKTNNPSKKPVWTSAYLDPAGQGWMVSCIVPIYTDEFLEGVTGLDVTINKFVNNILNLKLPWQGYALLVSKDGTILAMQENVEKLLKIKELKNHNYTNTIKQTNLKPQDLNIIKNKSIYPYFKEHLEKDIFLKEISIEKEKYILAQKDIEQTKWKLFVIVDKKSVYEPINGMEKLAQNIGIAAIFGMVIFYIIFFIFIAKKVQEIAFEISSPISKLASITKTLSRKKEYSYIEHNHIEEIDTLLDNFQQMTNDLFSKRKKLEELNTNLENLVIEEIRKNTQKEKALLHQSRLAQLGELISMISHQWRQPLSTLASISNRIKLKLGLENYDLESKKGKEEFLGYLETELDDINMLIQNLTSTIDDFREFYKPNKQAVLEQITYPIEKSLTIISPKLKDNNIKIIKNFDDDLIIKELFLNELTQVFLNILKNSIDAIKERDIKEPTITIDAKNILDEKNNKKLQIDFTDNGGGINKDILDNIFVPYFSTKEEKNGTGLGLYMSKTIIEQHHLGKISVKTKKDTTTFSIII